MKKVVAILFGTILAFAMMSCEEIRLNEPGTLVPLTVEQDSKLPSIMVNGAKLHSEAFGHPDSTIIVAIHGGPGGDYRYMLNCKEIADYGYRVVFYDQRGSGLSQRFPLETYTLQADETLDVIYDELAGVIAHYRTHPAQKVILLGHSWGAMLATAYAGKYPDSIQGLTIQEPGGLKWDDVMTFISNSQSFRLSGELWNDATYQDQFMTGKQSQHEIVDYKYAMLASKNDITGDDDTQPESFWRLGWIIHTGMFEIGLKIQPDFSEGISNLNIPVLFFYSEFDKAYTDEWAARITSVFNQVEVCKVPGTGHNGIISDKKAWRETTLPKMVSYFNSI